MKTNQTGNGWWDSIPAYLQYFLKTLLFLAIAIGGLAYIIHYIATLVPNSNAGAPPSPLDLAGVSGTIGALLLVGAFAKEGKALYNQLKRIGKFFLGAAVFLVVAFLLLEWARITNGPLNVWQHAMTWVSAVSIVFGICGLAWGLAELTLL